jgi:two-component system, cell cycle sensor histidine kinase and response regulator CckA
MRELHDYRLLLIEDSDDDAELILAELARSGYDFEVTHVSTADRIRAEIGKHAWTLVLSDYSLPGFGGGEALRLVRECNREVPFIIISGTIGEEVAVDLIRAGANDYVAKGNLARLSVAVERELERVALAREHARLAQDLERTRERLVRTVDLAPVGVCHNDLRGQWTMVNAAFCSIIGYSSAELLGKTFTDFVHPEDLEDSLQARRAMEHGEAFVHAAEKRFIRKDRGVIWASLSANLVRDEQGEPVYYVSIIADVTERRRTQEAIRRRALQQEAIALFGHMALAGCTLEMMLEELTSRLISVMDVDLSDVFCVMPCGRIRFAAGAGWPEDYAGDIYAAADAESHVGYALSTAMPLTIDVLGSESRFAVPPALEQHGVVSAFIVPVAGGSGGPFATIGVYSRHPRHFEEEDENFLRACANVVAEAVHRKNNEDALRDRARQQTALAELASRLLREPIEKTIPVCDLVTSTLDVEYAAFLEIDGDEAVVADGATWLGGPGARLSLAGSQTAYTVAQDGPVVIADYETETRFDGRRYFVSHGLRSGISVPVRGNGGCFGVIKAATRTRRQFGAENGLFLHALADLMAEGLERRATNRQLNASRERYQNVLEGAAEIIISVSVGGTILTLNKAFEQITGWPAQEWIGRRYLDLVVEDDREAARATFSVGTASCDSPPAALRIGTADGSTREIELSSMVLQQQGTVEIFGFGRDVTERRRSEAVRTRLADELALILDSVAEGIYGFDVEGRCTMLNRAAANMLGSDRMSLIGSRITGIHRADVAPGGGSLLEEVLAGRSAHVAEGTFVTVEGRTLPVEFSASPLIENDIVVGGVVCFWDISRRRHLEAQLEQERRLSSLGKLAASVAHEFNNVMMGIAPFAELIARSAAGTGQSQLQGASDHIRGAVRRGKRITEEILRFANPAPPAVAPVEVNRWLGAMEAELRTLLAAACELQLDAEPVTMIADASQMSQVVLNLAVNARDAMDGKGRLTISARATTPEEERRFTLAQPAQEYVHLFVRDTGSGIARENLDHIFEPLFTTKRSGTGLGLAISRQIIKRHAGEIFVETEPGAGSTFHIFLPRGDNARSTEPAVTNARESAPRPPAHMRVLLVEDDLNVAAGLQSALHARGIKVHHVGTGYDALNALAALEIDAAIVDIGLPDMDGTQVYEAGAMGPRIPVVFSTGHADESKVAPYLSDNSVAYLLKPYAIEELLDALVAVVS